LRLFPWKPFLVIASVFALLLWFHEPILVNVALARMSMSGQTLRCTPEAARASFGTFNRQDRDQDAMRGRMQLLREDKGLALWRTPAGEVWAPMGSEDELTLDQAEQNRGIYSLNETRVKPGDIVLDGGANIGLFSRIALKAGAAKVIAIEPVPMNLECLRRNLAAEIADGRVVVVEKGIWDKDDVLEMSLDPQNGAAASFVSQRADGKSTLRLPLTTVDKIVEELKLERVDFIKTDIEGAERRALQGAARTLAKFKPRMAICVYHLSDDPVAIPAIIAAARNDYRQECGPCLWSLELISPEVYFYY
jgi:FkbM family methyltransferase